MHARILVAAMALSACASPAELRESGNRADARSTSTPQVAALCMVRKAEEMSFGVGSRANVQMRPATTGDDAWEVLIYLFDGAIGYSLVEPDGRGSKITTYQGGYAIGVGQVLKVADGC